MEPIDAPPLLAVLRPALEATEGPCHRRLAAALRGAVLDGRLGAGRRLPASRALARALGVGRNTVVAAYEQLVLEGVLTARVGAGSFVAADLPAGSFGAADLPAGSFGAADLPAAIQTPTLPAPPAGPVPPPARLARHLVGLSPRLGWSREALPLRPAVPDLTAFPWTAWARCLARPWRRPGALATTAPPDGLPALQREIAAFLAETRAVACRPDQVMVLGGAQQALALASRLVIDPGDAVMVEDPGFPGVDAALVAAGAVPRPVSVDGDGIVLPEVLAPGLKALVVTPSRSYPLGITMSLPRRLAVLAHARAAGAWVIEDDYDSDVRFDGRPEPALQGLEAASGVPPAARRVLYAGTFVRAMFPSLRLGYLIVPDSLIEAARALRLAMDGGESAVLQAAMAAFMAEGHLTAHLRAMRRLYAVRRAALEDSLRRHLGDCVDLWPAEGGMHLAAVLPPGTDDVALATAAGARGVAVAPLSPTCRRLPRSGLLLGFAGWPPEVLERAVRALAPVVADALGSHRG
jgi:GntR family transcriptional regulator/MocR family aminotransferase